MQIFLYTMLDSAFQCSFQFSAIPACILHRATICQIGPRVKCLHLEFGAVDSCFDGSNILYLFLCSYDQCFPSCPGFSNYWQDFSANTVDNIPHGRSCFVMTFSLLGFSPVPIDASDFLAAVRRCYLANIFLNTSDFIQNSVKAIFTEPHFHFLDWTIYIIGRNSP